MSPPSTVADPLTSLSQTEWTQLVNAAFKQYDSVLALSRSPLANSMLVAPALVLDPVSPTADERGRALRFVLQWAVSRLAPATPAYPLGHHRPFDDPTWRDPRWWRYNILRHRYLEPLHPDDFVEGGRYTETLLALTGIPSTDTFFDERNRAIEEVARHLQQQYATGTVDDALRRLALDAAYQPLQAQAESRALLGIAATFDTVFPRTLLQGMAQDERLANVRGALRSLITNRFLLTGDADANLWLSPVLRDYVYQREPAAARRRRHRHIAHFYAAAGEPLKAAAHWQRAEAWHEAARVLLDAAETLVNELQVDELVAALQRFQGISLPEELGAEVQVLLSDLFYRRGQQEQALAACRRALQATSDATQQARIYRRMGKLYEKHNQQHALTYYQQALDRFDAADPERLTLLKDRAWLYILQREWARAEADLTVALARVPATAARLRADIYDALASLCRHQKQYDTALQYARRALARREETGDLLQIAKALGNLGLLYHEVDDLPHAIAAHEEALSTYYKLGNRELAAMAHLNIGSAHHLNQALPTAIARYRDSLAICLEMDLPLVETMARSNLAEALAEVGEEEEARQHWQLGYELSRQSGFDDQVAYFERLRDATPALQGVAVPGAGGSAPAPRFDPEEQAALDLVAQAGRVTARALMDAAAVSKATATRRLAGLVERGVLDQRGQGRGTHYVLAPAFRGGAAVTGDGAGLAHIGQVLRQHRPTLVERYGLEALGVVVSGALPGAPLPLRARFAPLPDLQTFFDLEARLGHLLGAPVDLKPTRRSPLAPATERVEWLWG